MCFRVDCQKCGKYSWAGCGKHLAALYGSIEEGKHCMCRSWPGVRIPTRAEEAIAPQPSVASPTTTTAGIETSQDVGRQEVV
ncbi:hypothetical protein JCGZ_12297 [Jatropha curcas]|uniref:Uncharacterized protein n=1 Tax=Jatropha curcas TaxID=180498 RepID=A0A067K6I1_JATCU|nr:hypothetical protein JCGZ_12297 [Jatropha curcas]